MLVIVITENLIIFKKVGIGQNVMQLIVRKRYYLITNYYLTDKQIKMMHTR